MASQVYRGGIGPFSDGMKLLIPREWTAGEKRVAVTPETVRRLQGRRIDIEVERGAGEPAGFPDALYNAIGASVVESDDLDWAGADGVLCVQPPLPLPWSGCGKDPCWWVCWRPMEPRS